MTYNVFDGTLNLAQPINQTVLLTVHTAVTIGRLVIVVLIIVIL